MYAPLLALALVARLAAACWGEAAEGVWTADTLMTLSLLAGVGPDEAEGSVLFVHVTEPPAVQREPISSCKA